MADYRYPKINLYFESQEQKQAFRLLAAKRGVSMAALARELVEQAIFLETASTSRHDVHSGERTGAAA